jgi:DNA primase
MIAPELIEQVRDAADIVQLIGEHVELKRTGSDWRGPCPFHGGTGRNFSVVPRKQMFHCFVCHESGDIFTFWMKRFGMDYPTAVREIAGRVGIVIPEQTRQGPDPNEPLYSALGIATEWFQRRLREADDAAPARAYLESRGLAPVLWDEFGLGHAPLVRDAFLDAMRALGVEEQRLVDAGLAMRREESGELVPRFRGRLLFPIADVRGRVVGFGGRILGDGEPKYLNSPESAVFHKGTLLYLLDRARGGIRTEGHAVVVEGYVDAIRLHAAGITCAVAPLGTALTSEQARVLRRYTKQVLLSYDADLPGLKSTFRAGDELLRQGAAVSVVTLPAGEDPDTLVARGGAEAFRRLMGQAVDLFDRKIQLLDRKGLFETTEGKRRALDRLLPTIRAAADPVTRALYLETAHKRTGVPTHVLEGEVAAGERRYGSPGTPELRRSSRTDEDAAARARPASPTADVPAERDLVQLMLWDPSWVRRVQGDLGLEPFRHPRYRALAADLLAGRREPSDPDLVSDWERLVEPPQQEPDREAMYNGAVRWLRERPDREKVEEIERRMVVAQGEEKMALGREKLELEARLSAGLPRPRRKAWTKELETN